MFDAEDFGGRNPGEGITFRDKRRIDPETGEVRRPQQASAAVDPGTADAAPETEEREAAGSDTEAALVERTADLQRLQAEYVNYKRRVDRDRESVRGSAVASVLVSLLPVLDDLGRARDHDELTGGFKAVADSLEGIVGQLGLQSYGQVGDVFDPRLHEALMHGYSDEVTGPVCQAVLQVGYRLGDRILRPARVAVAEPEHVAASVLTDSEEPIEDLDRPSPDSHDDVSARNDLGAGDPSE